MLGVLEGGGIRIFSAQKITQEITAIFTNILSYTTFSWKFFVPKCPNISIIHIVYKKNWQSGQRSWTISRLHEKNMKINISWKILCAKISQYLNWTYYLQEESTQFDLEVLTLFVIEKYKQNSVIFTKILWIISTFHE